MKKYRTHQHSHEFDKNTSPLALNMKNIQSRSQNNPTFVVDEFVDNQDTKIPYPNHAVIIGTTQSGKTSLIAEIFDSIDEVFSFDKNMNDEKKMIVISPMNYLEICDMMKSRNEWSVTLFSSLDFSQNLVSEIKNRFSESCASIKILLIDDFFVSAAKKPKHIAILNEIYALFRHENVSIFSTMHDGFIWDQIPKISTPKVFSENRLSTLYHCSESLCKISEIFLEWKYQNFDDTLTHRLLGTFPLCSSTVTC